MIVFYQKPVPSSSVNEINGHAGPSEVLKLPNHVWSRQFIKNPWPRTEDARKMVEEVSEIIREREIENGFLVMFIKFIEQIIGFVTIIFIYFKSICDVFRKKQKKWLRNKIK